MRYHHSSVFE
jgi:hypothetical protein